MLEGQALKDFKDQVKDFDLVPYRTAHLYLWTRRGAARHSKMLGTDQAWDMFDSLEENYFNPKAQLNLQGLSPQTQFAIQAAQAMAEQERKLTQIDHKVDAISDIVSISTMDWRRATRDIITKIAHMRGDDYQATRKRYLQRCRTTRRIQLEYTAYQPTQPNGWGRPIFIQAK